MKQVSISADISIFHDHNVGIQEGPTLSGNKLFADLERGWDGEHELTAADVQAFAATKALANAHHRKVSAPRDRSAGRNPT